MRVLTFADSIAIEILNQDALLTGVGNELHLHTSSGSRVLSHRLRGKVHGIVKGLESTVSADKVLVYGEMEFILLQFSSIAEAEHRFKLLHRAQLSDWIGAACFLRDVKDFVLLTTHSVLLRLTYDADCAASEADEDGLAQVCRISAKSSCNDKSTLYCSHLHGDVWEKLVVFGGGAFGELLIWQPTKLTDSMVELSDNKPAKASLLQRIPMHKGVIFSIDYSEEFKLLTTTSDDRSVRLWHVEKTDDDWQQCKLLAVASGYGHVARVFQCKIISHKNEPFAITVSEDSNYCIWRRSGELLHKRRQQFGAVIWNFAYDANTQTLFTVGSTGNLLAYALDDVLENKSDNAAALTLLNFSEAEYVAKAKFLSTELLIGVTNKNHMIYGTIGIDGTSAKWQLLSAKCEPYKCTVLEVYGNFVAFCGYKRLSLFTYNRTGEVVQFTKLYDGDILDGVIRAFHFLNAASFLVSDELGNCLLLRGEELLLRYAIPLPKCKEPWLTTALVVSDEFLLLSNRLGNLLLYKLDAATANFELSDTLKQPHGNLGATALELHDQTAERLFVRSAGHDGALRLLCISKRDGKLKSHLRQVVPVAWVERVLKVDQAELLLGFNDNHFVVWSAAHDFALQVPCGGGHRCWHYCLTEQADGNQQLHLLFIKNKEVLLHKLKLFNRLQTKVQLPRRNKWHIRSCNIMTVLDRQKDSKHTPVVVSAGDDNLIKISTFQPTADSGGSLWQHVELHTHISNVRALKVLPLNTDECLIFSGGGRAQLCVSKLNLRNFLAEELLSYTLKPSQVQQTKGYSLDPETRIMCCDVLEAADGISIYLGCSDGFVRKLRLTNLTEIVLDTELHYGRCVLQVRLVAALYVLVAGTDGILRFYNLSLEESPLQLTHHASGVNALDLLFEPATNMLHVLTGGDDQAVSYTALYLQTPPKVVKTMGLENQHTAQVTAACLRRDGANLYAFTSSVDQNIIKFNLNNDQLERSTHSCVADVKGLCLDSSQRCYLYGNGLQIYDFNS